MRSKLHVTPSPNLLNLAALLDPLGASPAHEHRIDWEEVYRLSALHLVTPILYQRLAETDRLADVPQDVRDALRHVFDLNAERNERQRRILHDTVRFLNEAGMEPLLLKGAVSLLPSQGPYAAARMLSDIDVLVPNVPPEAAAKVLLERGYTHMPGHEPRDSASCSHHLAPLFHPAGHGYVEIHRRAFMSARVPPAILPYEALCADAERVQWGELSLLVPSIGHRLLHNILHQQVQNTGRFLPSRCSLRQLFDFVLLRRDADAHGFDWQHLMTQLDGLGLDSATRSYLLSAELLFGQPMPEGVRLRRSHRAYHRIAWMLNRHRRLLSVAVLAERLTNLPRRLVTPSWYPMKLRAIRRSWQS